VRSQTITQSAVVIPRVPVGSVVPLRADDGQPRSRGKLPASRDDGVLARGRRAGMRLADHGRKKEEVLAIFASASAAVRAMAASWRSARRSASG
jgi:hypothetical protein